MTNKNLTYGLLITFVIAIIGLFTPVGKAVVSSFGNTSPSLNASGQVHYQTETFQNGLVSVTESQLGNAITNYVGSSLSAGVTYDSWKNTTGVQEFADNAIAGFTGTASSSLRVIIFATTTNPANFVTSQAFTSVVANNATLLGATVYASSTTATTTNSVMSAIVNQSLGTLPIPNNSYLVFYVQRGDTNCVNLPTVNGCEAATSTNRGAVPFWKVHLFR